MFDLYCIVRSVTYAQKGIRALEKNNIRARLLRSPRELSTAGCAYAICVRSEDLPAVKEILSRAGIASGGCYKRLKDGGFIPVAL